VIENKSVNKFGRTRHDERSKALARAPVVPGFSSECYVINELPTLRSAQYIVHQDFVLC